MTKIETTNFDNEMKALSMGVYKGNGKYDMSNFSANFKLRKGV